VVRVKVKHPVSGLFVWVDLPDAPAAGSTPAPPAASDPAGSLSSGSSAAPAVPQPPPASVPAGSIQRAPDPDDDEQEQPKAPRDWIDDVWGEFWPLPVVNRADL
jgi:hypothetical protein